MNDKERNKKILITGATGFIGGFIVDRALKQGMDVWAAVRKSSSRRYLTDGRINFIELDLSDEEKLKRQLDGMDFNYVVHAAGVTKCLHKEDFFKVNTLGTKNLVNAIITLNMPIEKFVYVSSLSVLGPVRENRPYMEITETDKPQPNTAYGKSKLCLCATVWCVAAQRMLLRIFCVAIQVTARNHASVWRGDYAPFFQQIKRVFEVFCCCTAMDWPNSPHCGACRQHHKQRAKSA